MNVLRFCPAKHLNVGSGIPYRSPIISPKRHTMLSSSRFILLLFKKLVLSKIPPLLASSRCNPNARQQTAPNTQSQYQYKDCLVHQLPKAGPSTISSRLKILPPLRAPGTKYHLTTPNSTPLTPSLSALTSLTHPPFRPSPSPSPYTAVAVATACAWTKPLGNNIFVALSYLDSALTMLMKSSFLTRFL